MASFMLDTQVGQCRLPSKKDEVTVVVGTEVGVGAETGPWGLGGGIGGRLGCRFRDGMVDGDVLVVH
jgi:hypothetical protein